MNELPVVLSAVLPVLAIAVAGVAIYAVILAAAVLAERIAPYNPREILRANRRIARYLPPSADFWLGTTSSGYDIASQLIHGARAAVVVVAPDAVEQRLAREGLASVGGEEAEELVLLVGEVDGLAVDGAGNICPANLQRSGISVISPAGELLGAFVTPIYDSYVTNLCFGGRYRNRLFMAASHSLYAIYTNTQGVAGG